MMNFPSKFKEDLKNYGTYRGESGKTRLEMLKKS